MRRIALVCGLFIFFCGSPARSQDLKRPEEQLAAIYVLKVQLEIEQRRLDATLQTYGENSHARE
ncbi:MAG TPA: hypothetical protein VFT43_14445, partial [Candidatus Polarisedimenticolia bacterium]|nr:hypothetical protein [Candidatus Polarisedimenticolia bacterium]